MSISVTIPGRRPPLRAALHFQPKIDLWIGKTIGVEAFVRWRHPKRGLMPPDQFIPAAEETELIRPLTRWVLDRALRQCRLWLESGLDVGVEDQGTLDGLRALGRPTSRPGCSGPPGDSRSEMQRISEVLQLPVVINLSVLRNSISSLVAWPPRAGSLRKSFNGCSVGGMGSYILSAPKGARLVAPDRRPGHE